MHHRFPQIDDRDPGRPLGAGRGIEKAGEISAAATQDQHQHGGGNDNEFFLAVFFALLGIFFGLFFPSLCVFLFPGSFTGPFVFLFWGIVVFIVAHRIPLAQFVGWKSNAVFWGGLRLYCR